MIIYWTCALERYQAGKEAKPRTIIHIGIFKACCSFLSFFILTCHSYFCSVLHSETTDSRVYIISKLCEVNRLTKKQIYKGWYKQNYNTPSNGISKSNFTKSTIKHLWPSLGEVSHTPNRTVALSVCHCKQA